MDQSRGSAAHAVPGGRTSAACQTPGGSNAPGRLSRPEELISLAQPSCSLNLVVARSRAERYSRRRWSRAPLRVTSCARDLIWGPTQVADHAGSPHRYSLDQTDPVAAADGVPDPSHFPPPLGCQGVHLISRQATTLSFAKLTTATDGQLDGLSQGGNFNPRLECTVRCTSRVTALSSPFAWGMPSSLWRAPKDSRKGETC